MDRCRLELREPRVPRGLISRKQKILIFTKVQALRG